MKPPFISFHMSLWLRISLVTSSIIVLCLGGFSIYTAKNQEQFALREIIQITEAVSDNVGTSVASDILEERFDNIEIYLLRQALIQHIHEVIVADANGKVLSQVRNQRNPTDHTQKALPRPVYGSLTPIPLQGAKEIQQTSELYRYRREITRGQRIAIVEVSASLSNLYAIQQTIFLDTLHAAAISIFCCFVLLNFGLRQTVNNIARATRFASSMANLRGTQLQINCNVLELRELLQALNCMSSELAQQHRLLHESEVRKSAILQAALDCVITIDEQGNIIDFNPAAESCFGYTAQEVIGQQMTDLIIPPAMRDAHRRGMAHFNATGKSQVLGKRLELTAIRRNGQEFPVELAIIAFQSNGQRYFCGYLRDISSIKAMEAESAWSAKALLQIMRERENQKFAMDQHSIVSICDAKGQITYANQKFTEISGYSSTQLLAGSHALLKSGIHSDAFFEEMWQCISSGQVWHGQIANRRQNGNTYWVAATIVPWMDENDAPYQYVAIQTDITEQKTIEHALEELRARELETGWEIQKSLLWDAPPKDLCNTSIATHSEASQGVDGDFFGFTRFSANCFEMMVGDVMGKGIPAALIGAAIKNSYNRTLVQLLVKQKMHDRNWIDMSDDSFTLPSPADIVNAMHHEMTERLISLNSFVTLALYRIDLQTRKITYVNAGHTPGLLTLNSSKSVQKLLGENLPIGVVTNEVYQQFEIDIEDDAMLLAYSDGITESRNALHEEFGENRLCAAFIESHQAQLPASQILLHLRQALLQFSNYCKLTDDQTAALIAFPAPNTATLSTTLAEPKAADTEIFDIRWDLRALGELRRKIHSAANRAGMSAEKRDGLILAVFESATNVIRHTPRPFVDSCISCRINKSKHLMEVELVHAGEIFEAQSNPVPDFSGETEGGFGLFIIEQAVQHVIHSTPVKGFVSTRIFQLLQAVETGVHAIHCIEK